MDRLTMGIFFLLLMLFVVREMTRADMELLASGLADVNKRQDGLEGKQLRIDTEQQRIKQRIEQLEDGSRLPQIAPPAYAPRNHPTPLGELMGGLVAVCSYTATGMHAFFVLFGYVSAIFAVILSIGFTRLARAKAKRLQNRTG